MGQFILFYLTFLWIVFRCETLLCTTFHQPTDFFYSMGSFCYKLERGLCISQFQQCPSPPGQLRGICSCCQSRGWNIRNFIAARGLGICVPRGDPRAFDTRVFESAMDEFSGKDEAFVEQCLVCQGLEKLVDVFKGMFSQFWIFLHLLEIFNVKNKIYRDK